MQTVSECFKKCNSGTLQTKELWRIGQDDNFFFPFTFLDISHLPQISEATQKTVPFFMSEDETWEDSGFLSKMLARCEG